jgi:RNA polymerase sigma factor (sigma-70 family)
VEGPLFCYVGADGCPAPERPLDLAEVRGILRERSPGVLPDLTSSEKRDCARRFIFGWLLTILRNDAGEALRQDNRRSRDLSLDAGGQHTTPLADRLPAVVDSVDPAHSVLVKEVLAELECIPDDERFVLKSYYLDEMTLEEIGRLLALMRGRHEPVSRQYVQQIKARGLNRMRQILNG